MLAAPFPSSPPPPVDHAEVGRQPWLVYGLLRTVDGSSPLVAEGNTLFTLLGFLGLYFAMGLLYVMLTFNVILKGRSRPMNRIGRVLPAAPERSNMATIWFAILAVMLGMYIVLDGFDFGVGAQYLWWAQG